MIKPKLPAIDRGVTSFWWAFLFFAFIWFGGQAVGIPSALAFMVGAVAAFFIFLFVRLYGGTV